MSKRRPAPPHHSSVLLAGAVALGGGLAAGSLPVSRALAQEPLWSAAPAILEVPMCLLEEVVETPMASGPSALPDLRVVAAAASAEELAREHPSLADRFELRAVEELLAAWEASPYAGSTEQPRDASSCALATALASPSSSVAAHARVVRARCLFLVDDPSAGENLEALLRRYPELPDEVALRLEEARSLERRGRLADAAARFRAIDLAYPGTREGAGAHERLAALAASGHPAAPLSDRELVDRATRLVRSGPPELARIELAGLREASLPDALAAEVAMLSARLARLEGRFDEADALTAQARTLDPRLAATPPTPMARPASEAVVRSLRTLGLAALVDAQATEAQRARALRRAPSARLVEAARTTARAGMTDPTTALVAEAARRPTLACAARFEIGVVSSGTASEGSLVALFDRCVDDAAYGIRARYLRARALERDGRTEDATAAYREVASLDRTDTGFYALWARLRLGETAAAPEPAPAPVAAAEPAAPTTAPPPLDLVATLGGLVERHGASYPWLARARSLVVLGERDAAREELHELYLAWLDARGRGPLRAGVEAVYRGATRQRMLVPAALRRSRRELAGEDAELLASVAEELGDVGLAIRFGGRTRVSDRPRAFEDLVVAAAQRHELDPNLLLAVMRVESVYDPEIVSYAGAIGLLQIMPRTGRLIAHNLGLHEFRTDDLLDPATNIEMAAWYLRSLLDRFEGRLPLAIAAYNGGPHNVRRWMEEHGPSLPLDAFLERIPFDQTFRYVRRVLSHYAAYRAQEGLGLPELDTTLPPRATDAVAF